MARPADWHFVGLAHDPVPGDPAGIRARAAGYAGRAADLGEASTAARSVGVQAAAEDWSGEAAEAFRARLHPVPGRIATASTAQDAVAAALRRWADALDDAQAQADRALSHVRDAHDDPAAGSSADAQARLDLAKRTIARAVDDRAQAEKVAERDIRAAVEDAEGLYPRNVTRVIDDLAKLKHKDFTETKYGSATDYQRFADDLAKLTPAELNEFLASLSGSQLASLSALIKSDGDGWYGDGVGNWGRQSVLNELFAGADPTQLNRLTKSFAWVEPFTGPSLSIPDSLFDASTPEWKQINQGSYGDCTWMAALVAAARKDPHFAEEHVRQNANGTVSVLLYNDDQKPQWVTVTGGLPSDGVRLLGATGTNEPWQIGAPTWVSYYEKALAQSVDNSPSDLFGATGTYRSFDLGNMGPSSMATITGHDVSVVSPTAPFAFSQLAADAHAGKLITIGTLPVDLSAQIPGYVGSHDFYFKGFDSKGDMIFGNPWGTSYPTMTVTPTNFPLFSIVAVS